MNEDTTTAEPLAGTIVHQVGCDLGECEHCEGEIIRMPPDWAWDHFDTGEPDCFDDSPLAGNGRVSSSTA